jgi:tetratricopeptide (TPR) repeat protein
MGCSASLFSDDRRAEAAAVYNRERVDELTKLFGEAIELSNGMDFSPADDKWTEIIEFAPDTSAAWSNRGTFRLQRGKWADAVADLERAVELEGGIEKADGYLNNNYANALGANGKWDNALAVYKQVALSSEDADLTEIAEANYSLGLFQVEKTAEALEECRNLLRKDPNFLDMKAAETAFMWASGDREGAESAWTELQTKDEAGLYPRQFAIKRVEGRWPPRCTAALSAFITVQSKGNATDYDGNVKTYEFSS